jgi:hypothetical protein
MAESTSPKSAPSKSASTIKGEEAVESLRRLSQGLFFPSETDAPIEPFFWPNENAEALSVEVVAKHLGENPTAIKTQSLTAFFKPLVTDQAWHNEAEKVEVKRFEALRDAVKSNLSNAKVFRVGKVEIAVYIVGNVADGLAGLKTDIVET